MLFEGISVDCIFDYLKINILEKVQFYYYFLDPSFYPNCFKKNYLKKIMSWLYNFSVLVFIVF